MFGVPGQPATVGVTEMIAVIAAPVKFVATNAGVFPAPDAASPIARLELVHVNVPPAGALVNTDAGMLPPLQIVMFAGTVTVGVGFTVIVYVFGVPGQPATVGVTVIVEVIAAAVKLVAVNDGVFPVPEAPNPMAAFVFVQAYVAPAGVLT